MLPAKPYRSVPIEECGEKLVLIPPDAFAFVEPHLYMAAGAPYRGLSPWMLRTSVLTALMRAQERLQKIKPGWKIMLFDAYRPHAVQAFMVERELRLLAEAEGLNVDQLAEKNRERLLAKVYRVWAIPSDDPKTPPPHSTGGVLDCTLVDEYGREIDMGSPIDENSDRSMPDYFANATDEAGKKAHSNRLLLNDILSQEGFTRIPQEWWHFSIGDQIAAWIKHGLTSEAVAIYGRADLLT